ncbi:MAG TPA: hypothetical protein VF669_12295, partial [Tepidisphaeraceae bacterium]
MAKGLLRSRRLSTVCKGMVSGAVVAAAMSAAPKVALADKAWNTLALGGDWSMPGNWFGSPGAPPGVPVAGEHVSLVQSDSLTRNVTYDAAASIAGTLESLTIECPINGTMQLVLPTTAGTLTTKAMFVGNTAVGNVSHQGGTLTATDYLVVGGPAVYAQYFLTGGTLNAGQLVLSASSQGYFYQSGGTLNVNATSMYLGSGGVNTRGTYSLSGTGSLNFTGNGSVYVGSSSMGSFYQGGGTFTIGTPTNEKPLYIGTGSTSTGFYLLTGTGNLTVNGVEHIGYGGNGTGNGGAYGSFAQTGGTHFTETLWLGENAGAAGDYRLAGGTLTAGAMDVGIGGSANVTQTGGSVISPNTIALGKNAGGTGNYFIGNGTVSAAGLNVGEAGNGLMFQSGGTITVSQALSVAGSAGGFGNYVLGAGGKLVVNGTETVGSNGTGTFNSAGAHSAVSLVVGATKGNGLGQFNLTSGTLAASSITLNKSGEFNMTGGTVSNFAQNGSATLTNTGGTFTYSGGTFNGKIVHRGGSLILNKDFVAGNGLLNES